MFYLCCIFCSFFKTFWTFEFAFHFIFMVYFFLDWTEFSKMWIVNESSSWAMGWRNLKSREMISCDSCHESEELDSDCENKNPVTHFYDLKCMTHKYLFKVHMTLLSSWRPFFPDDLESLKTLWPWPLNSGQSGRKRNTWLMYRWLIEDGCWIWVIPSPHFSSKFKSTNQNCFQVKVFWTYSWVVFCQTFKNWWFYEISDFLKIIKRD